MPFDLPVAVPDLSHDLGAYSWHFWPITFDRYDPHSIGFSHHHIVSQYYHFTQGVSLVRVIFLFGLSFSSVVCIGNYFSAVGVCPCSHSFWRVYLTFLWPQLHLWYSTLKQYPPPNRVHINSEYMTICNSNHFVNHTSRSEQQSLSVGCIWINMLTVGTT